MDNSPQHAQGSVAEVFQVFLKLGLTSFGGPIAHLGYFRDELVTRRRWLSDTAYADLVALCQFLPGPASSQVGFALGLLRAGWGGAIAAFVAFTLPSALILLALALMATRIESPLGLGVLHGLKIVAVAIVAQAVWGMARSLCPDRERATIAVAAIILLAVAPGAIGMMGAILLGAIAGLGLGRGQAATGAHLPVPVSRTAGVAALVVFTALLAGLPLLVGLGQGFALADSFYRAGSLVFGGGHVVLPLLQAETVAPGWVTEDSFLAGYGAAQAMPGPLFTFAAWLGAVMELEPNGILGAAIALLALFLPGFLMLIGALPFWDRFRRQAWAQSAMQGANAAVVGILGAALYDPVFTSAIGRMPDFALALVCLTALMAWKAPPWTVVVLAATGGVALSFLA
ncbi:MULTISPECIES: chromate efflux transporter [Mesorhizobium]|uniref:Chromate efflux transporter n=1 Tax=Mesorhizobium denitrificans TaxID=2294114 RepID=A0A371X649_9HYPH|nr:MULTISPECIES: chromate efflux transporter [Mesorhizobium]RFC64689.1 chromate efflux transporter [Mesorhizobium denitrificans]